MCIFNTKYPLFGIFITYSKVLYPRVPFILFCMGDETKQDAEKQTIPQLFGENVKKYRKQAGLTQEQLAERLEVTQKHLSIIETGTQFASAALIGKIAETLNVSPGDLFGGSTDEIKKEIHRTQAVLLSHISNEITRLYAMLSHDRESRPRP